MPNNVSLPNSLLTNNQFNFLDMTILEQKVGGHWAKGNSEKLYRIIFDDNKEADLAVQSIEKCAEWLNQYEPLQNLLDYINRHLIKEDEIHDNKPTVAIYKSIIPDVILSLIIMTITASLIKKESNLV